MKLSSSCVMPGPPLKAGTILSNSRWNVGKPLVEKPSVEKALDTVICSHSPSPGLPKTLMSSTVPARLNAFRVQDPLRGTLTCAEPATIQARVQALKDRGITLVAVRHGESQANQQGAFLSGRGDTPLTDKGRQQAQDAAISLLARSDLDPSKVVIYSSPLSRAQDTAKALQERLPGSKIQTDSDLSEIDFGLCEGRPISEVASSYPGFASGTDYASRFPGGESGLDVMERMDHFITKIEDDHQGQTVVFFAHTMSVGLAQVLLGDFTTNADGTLRSGKVPNAVPIFLVQPQSTEPTFNLL